MNINKKGTSIIEAIVVTLIISMGIVGVFQIFNNSQKLSIDSKYRLQATLIAREGVEGVMNIRDTNWKVFGANLQNCRNVLNYNSDCITDSTKTIPAGSYKIYPGTNNRWYLASTIISPNDFSNSSYRSYYEVKLDSNGLYTQSGGTTSIKPAFTREVQISYPQSNYMKVNVLVEWADSSRTGVQKVQLSTTLTNWKLSN